MFESVSKSFTQIFCVERKSFFSYAYLMYKFFERLDLPQYMEFLVQTSSPIKRAAQDAMFAKVCADLGWD
jgi:hypothetical protein